MQTGAACGGCSLPVAPLVQTSFGLFWTEMLSLEPGWGNSSGSEKEPGCSGVVLAPALPTGERGQILPQRGDPELPFTLFPKAAIWVGGQRGAAEGVPALGEALDAPSSALAASLQLRLR